MLHDTYPGTRAGGQPIRLPSFSFPDWMKEAACSELDDPDVMFPGPGDVEGVRRAKAICAECPVRESCLKLSVENGETHGVWGGTSARDRRGIPKPKTCRKCGDGFTPDSPKLKQLYCAPCRERRALGKQGTCETCGTQFSMRETGRRHYCSTRCRALLGKGSGHLKRKEAA